jgi:hypothetical protein
MKKTAIVVCILSSMSMMCAMESDSVAKAKQGTTIPRPCCLFTAAVPACYQCIQNRSNTPKDITTDKQEVLGSKGLSNYTKERLFP